MPAAKSTLDGHWLVCYDHDCGFCRWSLALLLLLDRDRRLLPVKLSSPQADRFLGDLTDEQRMASWHLVSPDGRRWSAGSALAPVATLLSGGSGPAALLRRAPRLADRGYEWIAAHRGPLGRWLPSRAKRRATRLIESRSRPDD
ncbi:MAG TPA: DCC1-like thiol-disulfide oxidoreductase family protein [Solirubrobacteraceae bacterium]|jgi:predicted DCC family thiol-disulfide oxidoreductase YuxK